MFHLIPWRRRTTQPMPMRVPTGFHRDFDELVERFFNEDRPVFRDLFRDGFSPAIDVEQTEDAVIVKAEIPGVDPKDLDVNFADGVLTIKGEKSDKREQKDKNYHRIERTFGSFSRSLALPCEIDQENIKADYKEGVLSLNLPKTEDSKKSSVKIDVEAN
jgi:HSP20 family protein